jgi:hypothetical protein
MALRTNYKYNRGEANRVVSGYSHLSGERAYDASMMALKDRYGDTDVIASAFIKKALEWPTIRNTDTKLLDEFALFLVDPSNLSTSGVGFLKGLIIASIHVA